MISTYLASVERPRCILEVGAGRSVFIDIKLHPNHQLNEVVITDRSEGMLGYSAALCIGAKLVRADAEHLPFGEQSFDVVISSLGDPYNTSLFWSEVCRVLTAGGTCIFTGPAAAWANRFRNAAQSDLHEVAVFETSEGFRSVKSFVMSTAEQVALIEGAGLAVKDTASYTRGMFDSGTALSPKISNYTTADTPIITRFVARKPAG